jgi:hypothetical protein
MSGASSNTALGVVTDLTEVDVVVDAPGAAGNSVPVTYMSGPATTKIVFPENYASLAAMSICTVSRYTSADASLCQRIFQPYKANINWLHGCAKGGSARRLVSLGALTRRRACPL